MGKIERFTLIVVTGNVGSFRLEAANKLAVKLCVAASHFSEAEDEAKVVSAILEGSRAHEARNTANAELVRQARKASVHDYPILISGPLWGSVGKTLNTIAQNGRGELIEVRCENRWASTGYARFLDFCEQHEIPLPPAAMDLYKQHFHQGWHIYANSFGGREHVLDTSTIEDINYDAVIDAILESAAPIAVA